MLAGLLANYWLLGLVVTGPSAPIHGWISDLGARDAPHEVLFATLDSLSGAAIVALAALLWPALAGRSRALRFGLVALLLAGLLGTLDGAVPLSCARSLDPTCTLDHDGIDTVHAIESIAAVVVTIAAFWWLGQGLRAEREFGRLGDLTLALGAIWLLVSAFLAAKYLITDLGSVKGLVQRLGQVALGAWLAALGVGVSVGAGVGGSPRRDP